eukprot:804378_1
MSVLLFISYSIFFFYILNFRHVWSCCSVVFNDNEDESTRKLIAVCQMISQSSAALPQVQHYNFNNINNNQFANTFPIHQLYGYKTVPHIHNRNNYKKQVPKHISSRGMPPPGSNTVTVNRTSKLSRQNTDYNIINPNNILQKKHMKKSEFISICYSTNTTKDSTTKDTTTTSEK